MNIFSAIRNYFFPEYTLEIGSIWFYQSDNPFKSPSKYKVLETKQGWVRYQNIKDGSEYNSEIRFFLWMYTPIAKLKTK